MLWKGLIIAIIALAVITSTSSASSVERGEELYEELNCNFCHVIDGEGTAKGPHLTNIGERLNPPLLKAVLLTPENYYPELSIMPSYKQLSEDDLESLIEYLSSIKGTPPSQKELDFKQKEAVKVVTPTPENIPGFEVLFGLFGIFILFIISRRGK